MRTLRFCFLLLAAASLAASCDPSAFGPSGSDPRKMAVPLERVAADLSSSGYQLTILAPFDLKPGSIVRMSGREPVPVQPPPENFFTKLEICK